MQLPYTLVANEGSGRRDSERLAHLRETLCRTLAAPVAYHAVRRGRDLHAASRAVAEIGRGTVFVAGGDGTISAIANAIKDTEAALAPIPTGTFNFFARGLGVPDDADAAIAALAEGEVAAAPVAEVNGRIFLNNLALGVYPAILAERERLYSAWGRSRGAAYWSVISTLARGGHSLRLPVTVDGATRQLTTSMLFVGASAYQLQHFRLSGVEAVRGGRLAAFLGADPGRMGMIAAAARVAMGRTDGLPMLEAVDCEELVIGAANRRLSVAVDGEILRLRGPLRLRMRPGGLRALMPADAAAKIAEVPVERATA
jgi:diacylglycerol kinase family enzyme